MTERIRDDLDALSALVDATADHLGIPASYVEKDFWLTEVLRAATAPQKLLLRDSTTQPVEFVFKGGTSLSRVFGIIERFSEDVDLLAVFPEGALQTATERQRHIVLKAVDEAVCTHTGLTSVSESSTTGIKRNTRYSYPTGRPVSGIKEGVLLELGCRGGAFPTQSHQFRSLVSIYAVDSLGDPEDAWEEFEPFEIRVLAPVRTLLEKLAAVHASATTGDVTAQIAGARHYYDIYRLLTDQTVRDALSELGQVGVEDLASDIVTRGRAASFPAEDRPEHGYAESVAFDELDENWDAVKLAYERVTQDLVYGDSPSLDEVCATVQAHSTLL